MSGSKGKTGTPSNLDYSPAALIRIHKAQARQEARWARKSGKVRTSALTADNLKRLTNRD